MEEFTRAVERPLGVTILAILAMISGILTIIGGIAFISLGPLLSMAAHRGAGAALALSFIAPFGTALGAVFVVIGIISLIVGWGLWKGSSWAWYLSVILLAISLISSVAQMALAPVMAGGGIVSIIIDVVILYYLFRPHVKEFFGI